MVVGFDMVDNRSSIQENRSVEGDNILMNTHVKFGVAKSCAIFGTGFDDLGYPCGRGVGNSGNAERFISVDFDLRVFSSEDVGSCC